MKRTFIFRAVAIQVLVGFFVACSSPAPDEGKAMILSESKRYFSGLQASLSVPDGFVIQEGATNVLLHDATQEYICLVALYPMQSVEQVVENISNQQNGNGLNIKFLGELRKLEDGTKTVEAEMEYNGTRYPGAILFRPSDQNTYLFLGCAVTNEKFELLRPSLLSMAQSMQQGVSSDTKSPVVQKKTLQSSLKSAQEYENFLKDKVLINSKHSNDIISTEDWRESRGLWMASEDVDKTRRFLLCGAGFGYYRFISTGHQITGDEGTFELDKHSGYWSVVTEGDRIGIMMKDERDGRTRVWEINGYKDNIIFIDKRPYEVFTQESGGNECGRADGTVVVPE